MVLIFISVLVVSLIFLIAALAWKFRKPNQNSRKLPYTARTQLLSPNELDFYKAFSNTSFSRDFHVCFKVRMADIIKCSDEDWSKGWGALIGAKHIDFTLCEPRTTKIIAAIEIDDQSHAQTNRRERDKFVNRAFATAGVTLIRISAKQSYSSSEIESLLSSSFRKIKKAI